MYLDTLKKIFTLAFVLFSSGELCAQQGSNINDPIVMGAYTQAQPENFLTECSTSGFGNSYGGTGEDAYYLFTVNGNTDVKVGLFYVTLNNVYLLNSYGAEIARYTYNADGAGLQKNIPAGVYYLVVEGTGTNNGALTLEVDINVNDGSGYIPPPTTPLTQYASNTPINYVRTWTASAPLTSSEALTQGGLLQSKLSTQYFDGLGRLLQTVSKKAAMGTTSLTDHSDTLNAKDLVSPVLYDELGREQYKFLPFASTGNNGQFKTDPYVQHSTFMNSRYAGQANDKDYGYSQDVFEPSPLNRVLESYAPGENWVGTTNSFKHGVKTEYQINTAADGVRIWDVTNASPGSTVNSSYASSGYYPSGRLYKNVVINEQNKQVIEFKDKDGRLVLKKVQLTAVADGGGGSGHDGWMCTYYIYDDQNNLRCVVQPEGVKALSLNGWSFTATILAEQCFRYEYDGRNRMIVKKVPGASEVVMVYDVRDRLVITQDGNLRSQGNWNYTQYDNLNRPVKTGLVNLQASDPNIHWNAAMSKTGDTNEAVQYPTTDLLSNATVLTQTFYDDYSWVATETASGLNENYDTGSDSYFLPASDTQFPYAQTNQKDTRTRGLVTGTKVNILGTPNYTYTLTIYDDKARPIQVKTKNHTTGSDVVTTQYSWSGQPLTVVSRENNAGGTVITVTTVTKTAYDALGRLVKTTKNMSSSTGLSSGDKIIAVNKYDELSQLVGKTLGATDANGTTGTEAQNYEYNIRGWLLGMNRGYASGSNNNGNFGFELNYDQYPSFGGSVGNRYYNGNIGGMSWRGKTGSAEIRRYDFSYDNASRIMNADFKQYNGSSFAATGTFNSRMGDGNPLNPESAYDYNGNIKAMTQQGLAGSSSILMDQLIYSYLPGSNKLAKVTDQVGDTRSYQLGDFNDGANSGDDYAYDANGNLTRDENKGIHTISYNILNLPQQIDVTGKGTISYQYDAVGNKLSKTVNETGQSQKVTTYLGGMVFENNVLQHVAMEEGRFRPNGGIFTADYFLKDHLGNVRSMINENGTLLEETHYYPFGLTMAGISSKALNNAPENKRKFIGQLLDDDLGLNWYQFRYRNHDPQIGRFVQVDPLATKYVYNSTYAYAENKVGMGFDLEGLELQGFNEMFRTAGINVGQANRTTQAVATNLAKKAEPVINVTKDVITIAGGVTLLVASGGTAAPILVGLAGSATVAGGTMKLAFDISGNKEAADQIPTTLSGTAIFLTNGASEAATGKKLISDDVKTVAEFSEGVLTFKVTGFDKMSDVEKASTILSGLSLTLDGVNPETAKAFQNLLGTVTGGGNGTSIKLDDNKAKVDNTYVKPPIILPVKN